MTVRSSAATPSPAIAVLPDVIALLEAPLRLRDKLIRGLMYATRMRVSEVARVRWRDVDFDRNVIKVWQGKGRSDRQVMLSECFDRMPESKQAVPPHFSPSRPNLEHCALDARRESDSRRDDVDRQARAAGVTIRPRVYLWSAAVDFPLVSA